MSPTAGTRAAGIIHAGGASASGVGGGATAAFVSSVGGAGQATSTDDVPSFDTDTEATAEGAEAMVVTLVGSEAAEVPSEFCDESETV